MHRWFVPVALVLALACGGAGTPDRPADTVVIGKTVDIQNWNYYLADSAFDVQLLTLVYPTLAVEQADYQDHPPSFEPWLAERWELSDDGLTLTFHLDPEARWSDGTPVTADDVLFTWEVQTSPEVGWLDADVKEHIRSVEKIDATTVAFRFSRRYPYQLMDANEGPIVPAHAWGDVPFESWDDVDWYERALAAGPFRPARHEPQQEIVLERNPRYWIDGRPVLDRVVWRVVPDQTNLLTQLLTGRIDFLEAVPPSQADRVRRNESVRLITFVDRSYSYVGWNCRREPFDDPDVRRALTMAIDRQAVIDNVRAGFARPAVGPVLSSTWGFNRNLEPLPYDPRRARRLLSDAGFADADGDGVLERGGRPFQLELTTNAGSDTRRQICLLIQENLARVGVAVRIRTLEFGVMTDHQIAGKFDAYVSAWLEGTQIDLGPVWHSAAPDQPTYNWVGYANAEVDRLLEQVEELPAASEQKPLLDRIQAIIHAEQPYTFLYESERVSALNRRVRDAEINDATPYFNLEEWRIESP